MRIDAVSAAVERANAAAEREAARVFSHMMALRQSQASRDTRVQAAAAAAAARPRPQDRELPDRDRLVDLKA
jgi:hypothetical protein